MAARDLRVLLVAHHAHPELPSEPGIGWRWAKALDDRVDLTLVTHIRNREAIERVGGLRGRIRFVDTERLAGSLNRLNNALWGQAATLARSFLDGIGWAAFDRSATRIARELVDAGEIDIVHRVSPISPRAPTRLGSLGVPLVLGPLNGGMQTAPGFQPPEGRWANRLEKLRGFSSFLDPLGRTWRESSAILVANERTRSVLPRRANSRAVLFCENGVDEKDFIAARPPRSAGLRALFVGRLMPCKGVQWLIRAIEELDDEPDISLDIVGDGPLRGELEEYVRSKHIAQRVHFHGSVRRAQIPRHLERADILCLPSVRESGGAVVWEAMAAGLPVLVLDHGGPSDVVDDSVGIRLEATSPEDLVAQLAQGLRAMHRDPVRRRRLGRAGRRRAKLIASWSARAGRMLQLYRDVLTATSPSPAPRPQRLASVDVA